MTYEEKFYSRISEIAPDFKFDANQRGMLGKWSEDDFRKQLDWLPDLIENARKEVVRGLDEIGCTPADVTTADCLRSYIFQVPASRFGGTQDNHGIRRITREEIAQIGMRIAVRQITVHCPMFRELDETYRDVFGGDRPADALGLGFWAQKRFDGMSIAEVRGHFEDSEEARGAD